MYLCIEDKVMCNLRILLKRCIEDELPLTDVEYISLLEASKAKTAREMADCLNQIKSIRTMVEEGTILGEEFFSGEKWFAEGVQSDKSAALLWNSETSEMISIIFYDKEYNLYLSEYSDQDNVPLDAIVKNPLDSVVVCIEEPESLYNKFNNCILVQG